MKRHINIIIIFITFFTLIFFCGTYAGDKNDIIELVVWDMPSEADKMQRQLWDEGIENFNTIYPKVKIKGISREYKPQEFVSVMASGKGPDIVHIPITAIPVMAKYGFLSKLNDFTEKWIQKDYMPQIMWNAVNIDGSIYGIPYDSYFTTLIYRRDIFEKCGLMRPPETWQEIIDYCRIIHKKMPETWGIAIQPDLFYFIDFIWQAGGDVYQAGKFNLNTPEVIKALKFWHDLKWVNDAMPPQNIFYDYDVEQLFSTGKIAMMFGVANRLPVMNRRYGMDLSNVEIVPLPQGDSGIKGWHAGGDAFIINADSSPEKKRYAWEYIKYVLGAPYQLWKWVRMKELKMLIFPGDFSCATNLINMPEFAKVKGLLASAQAEPNSYKWLAIKEDFNKYVLEKIFISKEVNYEELLGDFMEKMRREYNE
jgi:ABC-type glycerol-3-phosphate transport system substrate-binding protein